MKKAIRKCEVNIPKVEKKKKKRGEWDHRRELDREQERGSTHTTTIIAFSSLYQHTKELFMQKSS